MIRAGLPTTIAFGGTDLVTTAPAPTIEFEPIVTPARIGRVRADRRTARDRGAGNLVLPLPAPREVVVRERRIGADEDVVVDAQPVPELHAALDRDAVADHDIALDEHSVTEVAISPDHGTREHVDERPDPRPCPNLIRLAQALRMEHDVVSGRHRPRIVAQRSTARQTASISSVVSSGKHGRLTTLAQALSVTGSRDVGAGQVAERSLPMIGHRVVDRRRDPVLGQARTKPRTVLDQHDREVGDVAVPAPRKAQHTTQLAFRSARESRLDDRCAPPAAPRRSRNTAAWSSSMRLFRPNGRCASKRSVQPYWRS